MAYCIRITAGCDEAHELANVHGILALRGCIASPALPSYAHYESPDVAKLWNLYDGALLRVSYSTTGGVTQVPKRR